MKDKKQAKKRYAVSGGLMIIVPLVIRMGISVFHDRRYNLISILIVLSACIPFYYTYEKREGSIRRMVVLSVMTALAVSGRFLFAPIPGFKPVTAIVVLTAVYLGAEAGFLTGALSAIISNLFFGQGPWTPFQMFAWGVTGLAAGLPILKDVLKRRIPLAVYGAIAGIAYSAFMDIWTVLSFDNTWSFSRYAAALGAAIPFSVVYAVSNVVFLELALKPVGNKLMRLQLKHKIF